MYLSEKLVYVELQKTGCTHIVKLLDNTIEGKVVRKHIPPPSKVLALPRTFVGSIRNPWEWYVSLWAYGCDGNGVIYNRVTKVGKKSRKSFKKRLKNGLENCREWLRDPFYFTFLSFNNMYRNPDEWRQCYSDPDNPKSFRAWLRMMHDSRYWHDFGESYGRYPMSRIAGLLTYRYLKLFCRNDFIGIQSPAELQEFEQANCYIDHFIRTENLESDFLDALKIAGLTISDEKKRNLLGNLGKTNTSSRKHAAAYYYDDETTSLVADREQLLICKFGYSPPERADIDGAAGA